MGKDLRGKELGIGISQRKDGKYTARITDSYGKRIQKYFDKLQECRQWIADMQFQKEHGTINAGGDMTVDAWFDYWMENVKCGTIRENTKQSIIDRYQYNIKNYIGKTTLMDVKPLHCQNILNKMSTKYNKSTIERTRTVLHSMFKCAEENGLIISNPVKKSVKVHSELESKTSKVLTVEEQKKFVAASLGYSNHLLLELALQTGMRVGELTGLKWQDIDFENRYLTVSRTIGRHVGGSGWVENAPKTSSSKRQIPLTDEAIRILKEQKKKSKSFKVLDIRFSDNVFLTQHGQPYVRSAINKQIRSICRSAGIEEITIHTLRHTFATRCIEAGMKPKILQKILGHSSINMTMDLYVHATEEEKESEMRKIEAFLSVV